MGKAGKSTDIDPAPLNCGSDALKDALLPSSIVWKNFIRNNGDLELTVIFVDKTAGVEQ